MLIQQVFIKKIDAESKSDHRDIVAVEEPLEIRLEADFEDKRLETKVAITMRTPGNDEELTLGFLFTENIIRDFSSVLSLAHCQKALQESGKKNVMRVKLKPGLSFDPALLQRNFFTNSSCGICGKASLEAVTMKCSPIKQNLLKVPASVLVGLPEALREAQSAFRLTGGIHAAGLFSNSGSLIAFREDVGRHNALDKLIGYGKMNGLDFSSCLLLLSGRSSFELIQKAAMAGLPFVAGLGAPSSLAVDLALEMNISLIGFLKSTGFNVYSNLDNIA